MANSLQTNDSQTNLPTLDQRTLDYVRSMKHESRRNKLLLIAMLFFTGIVLTVISDSFQQGISQALIENAGIAALLTATFITVDGFRDELKDDWDERKAILTLYVRADHYQAELARLEKLALDAEKANHPELVLAKRKEADSLRQQLSTLEKEILLERAVQNDLLYLLQGGKRRR